MAKRAATSVKENRRLVDAKVRFVYTDDGGNTIYGIWVNARDAFDNGFLTPNEDFKVTSLQFDSEDRTERYRASDYQEGT